MDRNNSNIIVSEEQEKQQFMQIINNTYNKYFQHGPRSSKKVDYFHSSIKDILEEYFI